MAINSEIAQKRLLNQRLAGQPFETAAQVVGWLGAVQAQDYPAAKWAVAQRMVKATDAGLDQVFADGTVLRTHVLRPTWHLVLPQDIGWMLKISGSRVLAGVKGRHRQLELDETIFSRAQNALSKSLHGGRQVTRAEVVTLMAEAGVNVGDTERFTHVMMQAELTGLVCSEAMQGKNHTYALLEERVQNPKKLERDEALAELARRFVVSRGPTTIRDYVWWSGLTVADARASFESLKPAIMPETIGGEIYWQATTTPPARPDVPPVMLLPNYDEFTVAYADRSAIFDLNDVPYNEIRGSAIFNNVVLVNGRVKGVWKRTIQKNKVLLETTPFSEFSPSEKEGIAQAAARYSDFIGLPVAL